jgi:diguanylate cyclase (GGDEF)-like protein/putative nucleotidyltransferase with HDIG domain
MFGNRQQDDLLHEVTALRKRIAELEAERARQSWVDSVTGLLSARAFRGRLSEEVDRAQRHKRPLALAVISVDHFSALEVNHGFRAGDQLLVVVGDRLNQRIRTHDLVGRIAEAEFGLLLLDTDSEAALPALQRMLADLELPGEDGIGTTATSMGIALFEEGMSAEGLLASARMACAQAAQKGGAAPVIAAGAQVGSQIEIGDGTSRGSVEALALALGERDSYTAQHTAAVVAIAGAVARNLGCNPAEVERVKSAALLHDIGKVAIPDEVLHKPGPLTVDEWRLIREHPVVGERILRVLPGLDNVAPIVRHGHERWDGSGYPDGLRGDAIPLGSRIIIAADTYHAITSERPYRPARAHAEAVEELSRCAGSQFDPNVTGALIGHLYGLRQAGTLLP